MPLINIMKGPLVFLIVFLIACNSNNSSVKDCGLSKINSIDTTVVMDSITVLSEGKIVDACTSEGISAYVKFKNNDYRFEFISDSSGAYKSSHMPAGTYLVSAKQKKYKSLPDTLITFRSGQVIKLDLALAPE
jgi:hypothetical protein